MEENSPNLKKEVHIKVQKLYRTPNRLSKKKIKRPDLKVISEELLYIAYVTKFSWYLSNSKCSKMPPAISISGSSDAISSSTLELLSSVSFS